MARRPWDPEPKYVTSALAPYRSGAVGERREVVRRMLLRLQRFNPDEAGFPPGNVPSHRGSFRMSPDDEVELAVVAQDLLRELGYDAAADQLARWPRHGEYGWTHARDSLDILEAGPPSMYLDRDLVFKRPLYVINDGRNVIARSVTNSSRPWYRFSVGRPIHGSSGQFQGWDPDAGYTFQRCAKTLKEAREPHHYF